jgi:hypothetical protein
MENKGEGEFLQTERERVRRIVDVLFERFSSLRQAAHRELDHALAEADEKPIMKAMELRNEAIRRFQGKELSDTRFLHDQLRALIDSNEDPNTWPRSQ